MFAEHIGDLTPEQFQMLGELASRAKFRDLPGRCYMTSEVWDFWEPCDRAFFILLRAGGSVHRHTDEAIKGVTHHLVWETNDGCENWWLEDGEERVCHLHQGGRYIVQRAPIHWSFNRGATDRIHLLVEYS